MTREMIPYTEDPKLERKYQRLERLGQELKIPTFKSFLTLEVLDKDGNSIHSHKQRSHSWNRNAYNLLFNQMSGKGTTNTGLFEAGAVNYKDFSGTVRDGVGFGFKFGSANGAVNIDSAGNGYLAGAGVSTSGIMVGSGNTAESFEHNALATQIANGTGAGQISYVASEANALTYDVPSKTLTNTLVRFFNNNSGGDVTVNEVCLTGLQHVLSSAATTTAMVSRDVLGAPVVVPNTGQLKVTYTIELVYPA